MPVMDGGGWEAGTVEYTGGRLARIQPGVVGARRLMPLGSGDLPQRVPCPYPCVSRSAPGS